jgi:signal peptidase
MTAAAASVDRIPQSAWRKASSLVGTVFAVLVVMVAAAVVVVAAATRLSSKDQYTAFGHPILVVLSGSMSPAIKTGDLIFEDGLSAQQAQHLRVGQVVTFADPPGSQTTVTHRIVRVIHRGGRVFYVTKGDANQSADTPPRPASAAIGRYAGKLPRGGYFLFNLHRPIVLALLLAAPILWFVGEPLRRWARDENDEPDQSGSEPEAPEGVEMP